MFLNIWVTIRTVRKIWKRVLLGGLGISIGFMLIFSSTIMSDSIYKSILEDNLQSLQETDLILFPDKIYDSWWRKSGHILLIEDLSDVLTYEPDILIIGTGTNGLMQVPVETRKIVESKGIELIIKETEEACKTYNEMEDKKKIVAALHLTC